MSTHHTLPGACTCGRNRYVILIPPSSNAPHPASILFSSSSADRQAHSSPLPALLRIPLPWLHSTTHAYYADETHAAIRKTYTPLHAPHTKRHFCGFCGTPLTYWSESDEEPGEAETIRVNLSSLRGESLGVLAAMGVLPRGAEGGEEEGGIARMGEGEGEGEGEGVVQVRGQAWFEELIEGSELGRLRRRRGAIGTEGGEGRVEWEVVEFSGDGVGDGEEGSGSVSGNGKRKHGDVGREGDLPVREGY